MARFIDALRGDGLARAQRALAGLEGDPLRLDRERERFSHSPPPYTSNPSGTTTRSASPNPPSEEQRLRQERRAQLARDRMASEPYEQFSHQIDEEEKRVFEANLDGIYHIPVGSCPATIARKNVKKRWVEQGIWSNKWNQFALGRWKHEEPLELDSESVTDTEIESSASLSIFSSKKPRPQPKPRRLKSDDEKRRISERRVAREREREASRPYHQFVYQISKERERVQEEFENGESANGAGINTTAYKNVKNAWAKRGIWNGRWGILPGMSWKHEEPLEEEAADGPALVLAKPLMNGSHEAGEATSIRIFGSPPSVVTNHRQASDALNPSYQGPSRDINSAGLENGDPERPFSASNSPPLISDNQVLRPTTGKALLPSKRKASGEGRRSANEFLGPVHTSKVSKAAGKRKVPQVRLDISPKVTSDDLLLSSRVDAAELQPLHPPDRVTPRRSKRLRSSVTDVAENPPRMASTDPSKRAVRSKPERDVASTLKPRISAKPQGISKRPPAKTTRAKARKE